MSPQLPKSIPTIREWLRANMDRFGEGEELELKKACGKALNAHPSSVCKTFKSMFDKGQANNLRAVKALPTEDDTDNIPGVLSLKDVRQSLDKPTQILQYVKGLGTDKIIPDEVLRNKFGISRNRWNRLKNRGEFEEYRLVIPEGSMKGLLWGSRKAIQALKEVMDD